MNDRLEEDLKYPLIVKPANTDNSIGITNDSIVRNRKEFKKQLEKVILEHKRPALVEEYIEGDEVDISILGNDETMQILPLSRSIFDQMPEGVWHIYPFEAKWGTGASTDYYGPYDKIRVERPAKYPAKLTRFIKEIAADTYHILDCHDYGRVEVRVDKEGNPFILELNPNPSINKGDSTPNCAAEVGMDYNQFIYHILELAIIRYIKNPPYFHLQVPDPGVRRRENILKWLNFRYPAAATGEVNVSPFRTAL
jgi:D-alanine-D-alanine ligase